jgi:hypothetical protein
MAGARVLAMLLVLPVPVGAQGPEPARPESARWSLEVFAGTAWNAPTRLVIQQAGFPDIALTAHYETKAFQPPFYYAARVGRWRGRAGWDLELLHHKIHLTDPPAEVTRFEVTHGYNLITVQRGWSAWAGRIRVGAGVVVGHAASEVRGRYQGGGGNLFGGYHLAGPAVQVAAGRRWTVAGRLFVGAETKATAAWARVPVAGGSAMAPNLALHVLAGLGWSRPATP